MCTLWEINFIFEIRLITNVCVAGRYDMSPSLSEYNLRIPFHNSKGKGNHKISRFQTFIASKIYLNNVQGMVVKLLLTEK